MLAALSESLSLGTGPAGSSAAALLPPSGLAQSRLRHSSLSVSRLLAPPFPLPRCSYLQVALSFAAGRVPLGCNGYSPLSESAAELPLHSNGCQFHRWQAPGFPAAHSRRRFRSNSGTEPLDSSESAAEGRPKRDTPRIPVGETAQPPSPRPTCGAWVLLQSIRVVFAQTRRAGSGCGRSMARAASLAATSRVQANRCCERSPARGGRRGRCDGAR